MGRLLPRLKIFFETNALAYSCHPDGLNKKFYSSRPSSVFQMITLSSKEDGFLRPMLLNFLQL
jgi:hypothetical protein